LFDLPLSLRYSFTVIRRILIIALALNLLTGTARAGNSSKNFGGIGIDGVPLPNGQIEVKQLVTGSPAHLAGVRLGDIITSIDSKPTKGSEFKDIVDHRLRGRAGTNILIVIQRPGQEKPLRFNLVRKQLVIKK
jgi:C-terminal processing protease CtpA/Prc